MLESIPAIDPELPEAGAKESAILRADIAVKDSGAANTLKKSDSGMPEVGHQAGVKEIGGPEGPEPTRFGDWERKGRCIDF
jgi:hypothetical protein